MRKSNIDDVIIKFKNKHGDIYDYSKFEYINTHHKSIITCYTHGDFLQTPANISKTERIRFRKKQKN